MYFRISIITARVTKSALKSKLKWKCGKCRRRGEKKELMQWYMTLPCFCLCLIGGDKPHFHYPAQTSYDIIMFSDFPFSLKIISMPKPTKKKYFGKWYFISYAFCYRFGHTQRQTHSRRSEWTVWVKTTRIEEQTDNNINKSEEEKKLMIWEKNSRRKESTAINKQSRDFIWFYWAFFCFIFFCCCFDGDEKRVKTKSQETNSRDIFNESRKRKPISLFFSLFDGVEFEEQMISWTNKSNYILCMHSSRIIYL